MPKQRQVVCDFRIIRGPAVIDARDVCAEILLTEGWPRRGQFHPAPLDPSHPFSQVAPSLDCLADMIAPKGGWND
jgi:hypothetical protein